MAEVAKHPEFSFLQLDPLPDEDELQGFYQSGYYDLLRRGERAPDLARLAAGGDEADVERSWLRTTIYRDIVDLAAQTTGGPGRVVEVGSGPGDLLDRFREDGWEVLGLEPAIEVAEACRERGLDVRTHTLERFVEVEPDHRADAVVMRYVLEHVRDPVALLAAAHRCVADGGVLVVEVPNDFNALQEAARRAVGGERWWIAAPDHVNYFDFGSLTELLEATGFRVVDRSTTFPMELFVLMGDNYIGDPEVGAACHARRRRFELAVDAQTRRRLYHALAAADLGRSCLVAAVPT